jgi:hypothetical protein
MRTESQIETRLAGVNPKSRLPRAIQPRSLPDVGQVLQIEDAWEIPVLRARGRPHSMSPVTIQVVQLLIHDERQLLHAATGEFVTQLRATFRDAAMMDNSASPPLHCRVRNVHGAAMLPCGTTERARKSARSLSRSADRPLIYPVHNGVFVALNLAGSSIRALEIRVIVTITTGSCENPDLVN